MNPKERPHNENSSLTALVFRLETVPLQPIKPAAHGAKGNQNETKSEETPHDVI